MMMEEKNDTSMTGMVSVIVPAYGMGRYIADALASVKAQTYPNWEVIVVDDHGPEDGTRGIVGEFARQVQDHRVEFIRHEVNKGVSGARNTGIAAARGEFVAFLDPDDLFMPGHLKNAITLFSAHEAPDVVTGPVESFREEPGRSWTHKAWLAGWREDRFPHSLAVYNFIQPSATVVRRSAVLSLGGFDTHPDIQHIEDYDLWIRLLQAGNRFAFVPSITARYRKHSGGATSDELKFERLNAVLFAKHPDFFREGSRRMLRVAHEGAERDAELRRGPILALILWADGLLVRLLRKLGARP